ncbi:IDEAL domain-containing protein [Solibacillus sp. CAU 1738]|uniref:IDEAL domain-containing protein n=1 Tax=Solibacillus sp. CAU 1738 TaxID=3140363 RepID=UPI003261D3D8
MDKYYSYTDFLRAVGQYSHKNQCEQLLSDIYLDLFLNRLQRLYRIEQLKMLIDTSLDQKNEAAFYEYASELKELQEQPNEENVSFC